MSAPVTRRAAATALALALVLASPGCRSGRDASERALAASEAYLWDLDFSRRELDRVREQIDVLGDAERRNALARRADALAGRIAAAARELEAATAARDADRLLDLSRGEVAPIREAVWALDRDARAAEADG